MAIQRIDLIGRAHPVDTAVHHAEQQTGGLPGLRQLGQFAQVFLAAHAHRIGEGPFALAQRQGDTLDLHHAAALSAAKQKVETAAARVQAYLPTDLRIRCQRPDQPLGQCRRNHRVGPGAVHTGQLPRCGFHQLPGARQLAPRAVMQVDPDPAARLAAVLHRAGIGAVQGQFAAIIEQHIGQKPLVALHQSPCQQRPVKGNQHPDQLRSPRSIRSTACSSRGSALV